MYCILYIFISSFSGTIRKNRKNKKKNGVSTRSVTVSKPSEPVTPARAPLALDMDEMDFMDTGSEDSCMESATHNNRIKFKNSGYIEFVPNGNGHQQSNSVNYSYKSDSAYSSSPKIDRRLVGNEPESLDSIGIEEQKAGIDYIEQGASILSGSSSDSTQLKTPNNDSDTLRTSSSPTYPNSLMGSSMTSSLGSSISTLKNSDQQPDSLNDMEEDSLVMIMSAETITTTEESDALTVVTSPLDSTPAQILTTESSDTKTTTESTPMKPELAKQVSDEQVSYEEYVKQLQAKISKITSHDPSRRKSSKGDTISSTSMTDQSNYGKEACHLVKHSPYSETVTEPPTLSKKIELITIERDKQKDLIHDLVMDKLQQKKRLNAEKRLNRSRSRTAALSTAVASPTPPVQDSPIKYNPLLTQQSGQMVKTPTEARTGTERAPYTTRHIPLKDKSDLNGNNYKTPVSYSSTFSFTDKLRMEARQRARLLSNEDLGLSPEEKIQQLRKKYNIYPKSASQDRSSDTKIVSAVPANVIPERKLITSKSVNDIMLCNNPAYSSVYNDRPSVREIYQVTDFTSDPNLNEADKHLRERRLIKKDPERRRSLIQAVSDFFSHKKKEGTASSSSTSPAKETGASKPSSSTDSSRFGRFRLTSRKKDDDKAKVGSVN